MHNLILLHGAMGAAVQLEPLKALLSNRFAVHLFNFHGHGGEALPEQPFAIDHFAQQVKTFIDSRLNGAPVIIFGYSMGGYVAMRLAQTAPATVTKVATLATKYEWTAAIAAKEIQLLQPATIEAKVPAFAAQLAALHGADNWKPLMHHTAALLQSLGHENVLEQTGYEQVTVPVLLMLGDRDNMVSMDETIAVYRRLPRAHLGILPATPHPLHLADTALLATLLKRFFG